MFPRLAKPFDTTHNPVGLWNFNESLSDLSGNGYTLTASTGTVRYCPLLSGLGGALFGTATGLYYNVGGSLLSITGDMTLEVMVQLGAVLSGTSDAIVCYSSNTAVNSNDNANYGITLNATNKYGGYRYFHQHTTLTTAQYSPTDIGVDYELPVLIGFTRISNVIQFYRNGLPVGTASSALTAPSGGSNSRLRIGSLTDSSELLAGIIGGVKIIPSGLTAAQMKVEYNKTFGPSLGYVA